MLTHFSNSLFRLALGLSLFAGAAQARFPDLTHRTMSEVMKIARAIELVQPRLEDAKYFEYAMGIYRASKRYGIQPSVLIAITQQETGFRENLPEGKAGEIGICQIRKMWLKHPQFKAEFKSPTLMDLHRPAKSFLMAAWILRDIRLTTKSKTLPYWSYYNAVRFENRFKYFLRVNRNLAVLKKNGESYYHGVGEPLPVEPQREAQIETPLKPERTASSPNWIAKSLAALKKKDTPQDQLVRAAAALEAGSRVVSD